jgi:hypothetical protein
VGVKEKMVQRLMINKYLPLKREGVPEPIQGISIFNIYS